MPIKATLGGKFQLTNLIDPTDSDDAATKQYVDDSTGGDYIKINSSGTEASADGNDAIAIGQAAAATATDSIVIGTQNNGVGGVDPQATRSIAMGHGTLIAGNSRDSVGIGSDVSIPSGHENSIALGKGATTNDSNEFVISPSVTKIRTPGFAPNSNSENRHVRVDSDGNWEFANNADAINVVANPGGDPATELTTITIGDTDYTLAAGGTDNSAGNGITIGSEGEISVNLQESSGLEVDASGLAVDLQSNSGLQRGTNGLSVNPHNGISIDSNGVSAEIANDTLNLTSSGLAVNTNEIATREYVDFEFVENGSYANIQPDDKAYTVVALNGDLDNDTEVHVGTVGHFRLLSFHGHINEGIDFTGEYLRATSGSSTGYYKVNFATYESSDNLSHLYLQNDPVTGDDILNQVNTGDTLELDHDTDAAGSQPIHIGYGLTHDDDGLLVVDTDEILDTDTTIFGNPDSEELRLGQSSPVETVAVAQVSTITITSASTGDETITFEDTDGTTQTITFTSPGSNQGTVATAINTAINADADFVSSTVSGAVVTVTWDNGGAIAGTPLSTTYFDATVAEVTAGADAFYTYPDGFASIDLGTGITTNFGGSELSVDTEVIATKTDIENVVSQEIFWRSGDAHQHIVSLDSDEGLVDIHVADSEFIQDFNNVNYNPAGDTSEGLTFTREGQNATFPITAGTTIIVNALDNDYELDTTNIPTPINTDLPDETIWIFPLSAVTILRGTTPVVAQINLASNGTLKSIHNRTAVASLVRDTYVKVNSTGTASSASGTDAIAIGKDTQASSNTSIAIGSDTKIHENQSDMIAIGTGIPEQNVTTSDTIAIGRASVANATNALALGPGATASDSDATALGDNAEASGNQSLAVGKSAEATADNTIAVGANSRADGTSSIAIGENTLAFDGDGIAIGRRTISSAADAIAIGQAAQSATEGGIAIGNNAATVDTDSVALGKEAVASGGYSIALGDGANTGTNVSISFTGISNISATEATFDGIQIAGSDASATNSVTFPNGYTVALQQGFTFSAIILDSEYTVNSTSFTLGFENATLGGTLPATAGSVLTGFNRPADNAIAIGRNANADTDNQLVIGSDTASESITAIKTPGFSPDNNNTSHRYVRINSDGDWSLASGGGLDHITSFPTEYIADSDSEVNWHSTGSTPNNDWEILVTGTGNTRTIEMLTANLDANISTANFLNIYQAGNADSTDSYYRIIGVREHTATTTRITVVLPELLGNNNYLDTLRDSLAQVNDIAMWADMKDTNWGANNIDTEVMATRAYVDDSSGGDTVFVDDGVAALSFISDNDSDVDYFASKNDTFAENDVYILANEGNAGENWYGCYFRVEDVNDTDLQSARYLSISDGTDTGYFRVLRSRLATTDNSNKLVLVDIQTEPFQGTFDLTNYRVLAASDTVVDSDTALSFRAAMDAPRSLFADQFVAGTGITLTDASQTDGTNKIRIAATGDAEANLGAGNEGNGITIASNRINIDTDEVFIFADSDAINLSTTPITDNENGVAQVSTITITNSLDGQGASTWTLEDVDGSTATYVQVDHGLATAAEYATDIATGINALDFVSATSSNRTVTVTWDTEGAVGTPIAVTQNVALNVTIASSTDGVTNTFTSNSSSLINLGTGLEVVNDTEIAIGESAYFNSRLIKVEGDDNSTEAVFTGQDSIAIGASTQATGTDSVAMGQGSRATASGTVAVGNAALADTDNALAKGNSARAQGEDSVALGPAARVLTSHSNSVALGNSSTSTQPNQIMLGNSIISDVRVGNTAYSPSNAKSLTDREYVDDRTQWIVGLDSDAFSIIHHNRVDNSFTHKSSGTPAAGEVVIDTNNDRLEFRNADLNLLEIQSATILNINYDGKFGYYRITDVSIGSTRTIISVDSHQLGVSADDSDTLDQAFVFNLVQNFVTIYADIKDKNNGETWAAVVTGGQVGETSTVGGNTYLSYTMTGGTYYREFTSTGENIRVLDGSNDGTEASHYTTIASKTY